MLSIFAEIQGLSQKSVWLTPFFFVDSNSPYKDILFPHGLNLVQKPLVSLYLVGALLIFMYSTSDNINLLLTKHEDCTGEYWPEAVAKGQ